MDAFYFYKFPYTGLLLISQNIYALNYSSLIIILGMFKCRLRIICRRYSSLSSDVCHYPSLPQHWGSSVSPSE